MFWAFPKELTNNFYDSNFLLLPVFIILSVIISSIFKLYLKLTFWKRMNVNGPKPLLFFGNFILQILKKDHSSELSKKYYDEYPLEKVVGVYRFMRPCLIIRDQTIIKDILIKDFSVFSDRGAHVHKTDMLNHHIFNLSKTIWKPIRGALSSSFTNFKINSMLPFLFDITDNFIFYLDSSLDIENSVDICSVIFKYTTEIIGRYGFSLNMNEFSNNTTDFSSNNSPKRDPGIFTFINAQIREYYGFSLPQTIKATKKKKSKQDFYMKFIKEIKNYREQNNIKKKDYMGKLIDLPYIDTLEKYFINKEECMSAQAYVFFTAGSEGISISISNALYEIAKNEAIQIKLRTEILKMVEEKSDDLTINDINKMTYLDKVFKETLRKYPLRDIIRNNNLEYTFKDINLTIPKNTGIIIPHYAISRDRNFFPNPEHFDPERFENQTNELPYFPFGEGPRKCIGSKFANYIFKICIIKIVQNFKILHTSDRRKNNPWKVFLFPKGGIKLKFLKL